MKLYQQHLKSQGVKAQQAESTKIQAELKILERNLKFEDIRFYRFLAETNFAKEKRGSIIIIIIIFPRGVKTGLKLEFSPVCSSSVPSPSCDLPGPRVVLRVDANVRFTHPGKFGANIHRGKPLPAQRLGRIR